MIDWKNAPKGATHWDTEADLFCNKHGFWGDVGQFIDHDNQLGWGTDRYTARPTETVETARSVIDWKNAPEGAERFSSIARNHWLQKVDGEVWCYVESTSTWRPYNDEARATKHWGLAITRPVVEAVAPIPTVEQPVNVTVDETIETRGERYGKFNEGAEVMQDLKNVMRSTHGWERLTPSQREALEMIQHKIGRVLNGDPTYDDNWRDICGYSQLILDELNGDKR